MSWLSALLPVGATAIAELSARRASPGAIDALAPSLAHAEQRRQAGIGDGRPNWVAALTPPLHDYEFALRHVLYAERGNTKLRETGNVTFAGHIR